VAVTEGVEEYKARPLIVEAMQVNIGTTTRQQIKAFCPHANVGATDEVDVRWCYIVRKDGVSVEVRNSGDWIVKSYGDYRILTDEEFNERYVAP
jgi:hypothetical protein